MASTVLVLAMLALQAGPIPTAPQGPDAPAPTAAELEEEVLRNVKGQLLVKDQPLAGTVEDLNLPEEFLRRIADRIIRVSYEERYRIVVKDEEPPVPRSGASAVVIALLVLALCAAGFVGVILKRRGKGRAA